MGASERLGFALLCLCFCARVAYPESIVIEQPERSLYYEDEVVPVMVHRNSSVPERRDQVDVFVNGKLVPSTLRLHQLPIGQYNLRAEARNGTTDDGTALERRSRFLVAARKYNGSDGEVRCCRQRR
jgi:hypothetical protein